MDEGLTVRWFWGYDADGRRITQAEPVAVRFCVKCNTGHPVVDVRVAPVGTPGFTRGQQARYMVNLRPRLLAAPVGDQMHHRPEECTGILSSEFPPDD